MLQTKQRHQQHLYIYPQIQQFPRAPLLSRVPSTRSPVAPLLSLPNQPPRVHSDHHIHPGARMANRPPVGHPPLTTHGVRPAPGYQSLLGPKPMMQQPVVMHQMPGMPGGPRKQIPPPFVQTGIRQSILGPAPFGTPLRSTHMGFVPGHQFHSYGHYMNKRGSLYSPQRKRENGHTPTGKNNGQMNKTKTPQMDVSGHLNQSQVAMQRSDGESESGDAEQKSADTDSSVNIEQEEEENHSTDPEDDVEQERTAEVQGVGTSLKVTIQRSSDSRAFSTGLEEIAATASHALEKEMCEATNKFCCKICNVTCPDQQEFQTHMISLDHQQKMMEIQHLSNTCLATLLPQIQQSLQGAHLETKQGLQRWCTTCQCHFTDDIIEHRRTKMHKMAKVSSRPYCTVCERHFRTPRKFVEHMKSPEHKERVEELRVEKGPEIMEELITVDAIGCFEGEDDYEEEGNEDEEDGVTQPVSVEEMNDDKEYNPDTQYGTSFVVPVAGFLCKLCHKFYHFESSARETHCKSLMHYQNLQKYKGMLDLPQKDADSLFNTSGDSQNSENSCGEDTGDKCKEEKSKSPSDSIKCPAHVKQ
ncbi:cip1-interacting zinc finger protein-like isoform X2 [Hoplias malabaricus]|uniref:cip1-interacting zinc finger protein-like isoform X2 n=1 Tax=Hoplias malabaricus TaxID=27720 RepID=UPI0034631FEA